MVLIYSILKLAVPRSMIGYNYSQYSLIALDSDLLNTQLSAKRFKGVALPLDYSGFDESISLDMILILIRSLKDKYPCIP